MSDLRELYQEVIMDHNKRPRNFHKLNGASCSLEGYNPLCGDRLVLYLDIEGDVISEVAWEGSGCAISKASTSMMTESIKGKTMEEAEVIFDAFHRMITGGTVSEEDSKKLEDLEVLAGVSDFPTRVKCAVLSWHTLRAALRGQRKAVSTE